MEVKGKGGISAKIIADSVSSVNGQRITTFELEYPRFIHSEFMTHRLFSRNAASSRAIPVKKIIEQVESNPATPIHWGLNQKGMQASEEHENTEACQNAWQAISNDVCEAAEALDEQNLHKQVINRILEPYQFIKVVCTATEFDNFFWLRCHEDAQPEIKELADCMYKAHQQNTAFIQELESGEWHTPYVDYTKSLGYTIPVDGDYENGRIDLTLEEALKVSSSCCAQVSFRALDNSLEKACKIYNMLVESKPVHASPLEHQGTPMKWAAEHTYIDVSSVDDLVEEDWDKGTTHMDKSGYLWSGNFKGFIQHRQLIPENACWKFNQ